jgi:putative endonuclease
MARFDTIAVYMMASKYRGRIYLGVTSDLVTRVSKHRIGEGSRFTDKYWCRRLAWYEVHSNVRVAIQRETSLKRYLRAWKIELIEKDNPNWVDLWYSIVPGPLPGEQHVTPEQLLRGETQDPGNKSDNGISG